MHAKKKKKYMNLGKGIFAWALSLVVIVPFFLIVLLNALKSSNDALTMSLTLPKSIHWANFKKKYGKWVIFQDPI